MCDEIVIPVVVIKPFEATRTPCPPAGTHGELYRFDNDYACVRFQLPVVDTEGHEWHTQGDGSDNYMRLKFKMDEIEATS